MQGEVQPGSFIGQRLLAPAQDNLAMWDKFVHK